MSRPNRFAETLTFSSPIDCVRRKLDFGEVVKKPRPAKTDGYHTENASNSSVRRRLDFGETDPSVLLVLPDLLPNRCQSEQDAREQSCRARRTCLTLQQKTALEQLFLKNMFPNRREKSTLAIEHGTSYFDVQMWFRNRRQRWKKDKNANTVDELTQENEPSLSPRQVRNFYYLPCACRTWSSSVPDSLPVLLKCDREVLEPRDITPDKELSNSRRLTSNDKFARFVRQD